MPETNPFANFPASNEAATTQVESLPARRIARDLFWSGWTIASIAKHIGEKRSTVETWKQRGEWDKASALDKLDCALEQRLVVLIAKDIKDGRDFKEIDLLGRQIERMHQIRGKRRSDGDASARDDDATPSAGSTRGKRRSRRNAMDDEQIQRLCDGLREILIGHQHAWFESRNMRMRNILKSRQIGATFYFALEALIDALETGRNQVFLSASREPRAASKRTCSVSTS
ncbi:MAG: terminase family protein [Burkholderia gladioli]